MPFDQIAKDIATREGQCVLLLGPELSVKSDGTYYKSFFKELKANSNGDIVEYFENENIFSFKDETARDRQINNIRNFYGDVGDDVLLHLITKIQFPLIINVCPDTSLKAFYDTHNVSNNVYDYRCIDNSIKDEPIEVPKPTKAKPVLYNLFGDWEVIQSLIYDHYTFYNTIEHLLSKDSIPPKIQAFLNKTNSYVFLGFDFDSWHYQLVCHKLGLGKATIKKSYGSPSFQFKTANVGIVIKDYFKVTFIQQNPTNTIQEIIHQCENLPNTLRDVDSSDNYGVYISYAWKDKEADILEMLREIFTTDRLTDDEKLQKFSDVIVQSGKLINDKNDLETLFKTGKSKQGELIEEWYFNLPTNKINKSKNLDYNREHFVNILENKLTMQGIKVFRDRNEVTYGDSIDSFMNRIGMGKVVIRIVSDKYLKSRYCMDEALRIKKASNDNLRVFTVFLKDEIETNLKAEQGSFEKMDLSDKNNILYKKYWEILIKNVYEKIDNSISGSIDKERIKRYYSIYIDIYDYIIEFIQSIQNEVHLELEGQSRKNFLSVNSILSQDEMDKKLDGFVQAIIQKLQSN